MVFPDEYLSEDSVRGRGREKAEVWSIARMLLSIVLGEREETIPSSSTYFENRLLKELTGDQRTKLHDILPVHHGNTRRRIIDHEINLRINATQNLKTNYSRIL
jgi:hypothetical protein